MSHDSAEAQLVTCRLTRACSGLCKNVGWPIVRAKVLKRVIYVFVCLNGESTPPSYFVATSAEVRPRVKEYPQPDGTLRGILNFGAVNTDQFRDRWDKSKRRSRRRS
jgi:hypothetical protein